MSDKNQITIGNTSSKPPVMTAQDELLELQKRRELLQIQQLESQLRKDAAEQQKIDDAKNRELALRRENLKGLEKRRAEKKMAQDMCSHLKENGKTAVMGQRDSKQVHHWICQQCLREFTGNDPSKGGLPYSLQPDPMKVGGPNF